MSLTDRSAWAVQSPALQPVGWLDTCNRIPFQAQSKGYSPHGDHDSAVSEASTWFNILS